MQNVHGSEPGQKERRDLYDRHGRYRSRTIAFRVSPEEAEQISFAISLTGMLRQEYLVAKALNREIQVTGNSKIHKAVFDRLGEIKTELERIESGRYINEELTNNIKLIATVINSLYMKNP